MKTPTYSTCSLGMGIGCIYLSLSNIDLLHSKYLNNKNINNEVYNGSKYPEVFNIWINKNYLNKLRQFEHVRL